MRRLTESMPMMHNSLICCLEIGVHNSRLRGDRLDPRIERAVFRGWGLGPEWDETPAQLRQLVAVLGLANDGDILGRGDVVSRLNSLEWGAQRLLNAGEMRCRYRKTAAHR